MYETSTLATAALWMAKMSLESPKTEATPGALMPADSAYLSFKKKRGVGGVGHGHFTKTSHVRVR